MDYTYQDFMGILADAAYDSGIVDDADEELADSRIDETSAAFATLWDDR